MTREVRIVGINASQRENSNSGRLLDHVLLALAALHDGYRASRFELREMQCACLGCERCFADAHTHDDDISTACDAMLQADIILFATPTCYGMPTALGKMLMDRTDAFWHGQLLKGKIGASIVNGASPHERIAECARAVDGYFQAQGMRALSASPAFANTMTYPGQRFPDPLPDTVLHELDALARAIDDLSAAGA